MLVGDQVETAPLVITDQLEGQEEDRQIIHVHAKYHEEINDHVAVVEDRVTLEAVLVAKVDPLAGQEDLIIHVHANCHEETNDHAAVVEDRVTLKAAALLVIGDRVTNQGRVEIHTEKSGHAVPAETRIILM